MTQIITDPTHTQDGILDLVITNQPESVSNITIDYSSPIVSDYYMILFDITIDEIIKYRQTDGHSATLEQTFQDLEYLFEVNFCPAALDVSS